MRVFACVQFPFYPTQVLSRTVLPKYFFPHQLFPLTCVISILVSKLCICWWRWWHTIVPKSYIAAINYSKGRVMGLNELVLVSCFGIWARSERYWHYAKYILDLPLTTTKPDVLIWSESILLKSFRGPCMHDSLESWHSYNYGRNSYESCLMVPQIK